MQGDAAASAATLSPSLLLHDDDNNNNDDSASVEEQLLLSIADHQNDEEPLDAFWISEQQQQQQQSAVAYNNNSNNYSDQELVDALSSLGIVDDDATTTKTEININDVPATTTLFAEELPKLEFNCDDDDLLQYYSDDEQQHTNLWNVFDESSNNDNEHPDALEVLEQLEHLTLFDNDDSEPLQNTNNNKEQTWLQPFQEPLPLEEEEAPQTLVLQALPLDEQDNDIPFLYCQPCNDDNDDAAWTLAAVLAAAEQQQQQQLSNNDNIENHHPGNNDNNLEEEEEEEEDALFWQEQIKLLLQQQPQSSSGLALSPHTLANADDPVVDPFELFQFMMNDTSSVSSSVPSDHRHPQIDNDDDENKDTSSLAAAATEPQQQNECRRRSIRPKAMEAARPFVEAFGSTMFLPPADHPQQHAPSAAAAAAAAAETNPKSSSRRNCRLLPQRECLGHRERVLGCDFSPDGKFLATASQDSTVRIWSTATHRQVALLDEGQYSKDHECLRVAWANGTWGSDQIDRSSSSSPYAYLLATGGADGRVHLWGCRNNDPTSTTWTNYATLDHATYRHVVARSKTTTTTNDNRALDTIDESKGEDDDQDNTENDDADKEVDKPQIYSLQFIDHWKALPNNKFADEESGVDDGDKSTNNSNSFLLTSSDDYIHLWEIDEAQLNKKTKAADGAVSKQLELREVMSIRFGPLQGPAYGVTIDPVTENSIFSRSNSNKAQQQQQQQQQHSSTCPNASGYNSFGGERNPDNLIFVFDASYCSANGLLGAALSDGSLRLMNGRGVCLSVLHLPGCQSHLTSFSWDSTGERLATTVATGHLITWGIQLTTISSSEAIKASCHAVMEGGHVRGRPLFGTRYLENDELLISWGSDGRLCLWDSRCQDEEIDSPLSVLWDNNKNAGQSGEGYPIYAVSVTRREQVEESNNAAGQSSSSRLSIAIAGGGSDAGFLGIPVYLQDVENHPDFDEECPKDSKKSRTSG